MRIDEGHFKWRLALFVVLESGIMRACSTEAWFRLRVSRYLIEFNAKVCAQGDWFWSFL